MLGTAAAPACAVFAVAIRAIGASSALYLPAVGLGWAGVELLCGRLWPAIPWLKVGATQIDTPLAPLAAVIGVLGVSALVACGGAAITQALLRVPAHALAWAPALALVAGSGAWLARAGAGAPEECEELRIALVQPGLPMSARADPLFPTRNLDRLLALSRELDGVELIVWPESAFTSDMGARSEQHDHVQAFVDQGGIPILAGGYRRVGAHHRTSAFLFAPGERPRPVYDKQRLLPLAEAVPRGLSVRVRHALGRLVPLIPVEPGTAAHGPGEALAGIELLLCYEAVFAGAGFDPSAGVLVNLVNDGWYDRSAGAAQHLLLARWRAIEAGAPLVRAAATGTSAFVSREGRLLKTLGVGQSGSLELSVDLAPHQTPYERWGDAPLIALASALAISIAWPLRPRLALEELLQ